MKGQIQFSISWRRAGVPKVVKSIIWQELYYISKTPPFSTKETEMCRDGLLTFSVRFREEREKYLSSSSAPSSSPNRYLPDPPLSVWNLIIDLIMPNTCPHKMISTIWEKCRTRRHLLTLQVGLLETKKIEILGWNYKKQGDGFMIYHARKEQIMRLVLEFQKYIYQIIICKSLVKNITRFSIPMISH